MAGFKRPQRSLIALGVVLAGALSSVGCSSSSTSPTVSEAPEPSTTTVAEVTSDDVGTTSLDPTTTTVEVTTTSAVVFLRRSQEWDRTDMGYRGLVEILGQVLHLIPARNDDANLLAWFQDLKP